MRRGGGLQRERKGDQLKKSPGVYTQADEGTNMEANSGSNPDKRRGERARPTRKRPVGDGDGELHESGMPSKKRRVDGSLSEVLESKSSKSSRHRAKPGAALAMAKRETASIVPSQGKKIVF